MSERERRKLNNRILQSIEGIGGVADSQGFPIYDTFHKLPPRTGTDYYKVVKSPISLHSVKLKAKKFQYVSAQEFINDLAQMVWNAKLYNLKGSAVYIHAELLDKYLTDKVFPKLSTDKAISGHTDLYYPDLGPLPEDDEPLSSALLGRQSSPPAKDDEYEENDDEEYEEYPSLTPQPRRTYQAPKVHAGQYLETGVRRGRPPTVDKPYETRIKLILKSLKKVRTANDQPINIPFFDKLPDRNNDHRFYEVVHDPISLFEIKSRLRTRKYTNVDEFLNDLNLLFYNSKLYHGNDTQMFQLIDYLQQEVAKIIEEELKRSEHDLIAIATPGGDGVLRFPLDSLSVHGYVYNVGDWVLINNPNDPEKPTVGQIFRLWSLKDGTQYFNACWYYRAEQTCHRYDRLFYINEVCKTGQYRDHLATEIVGPCYVVFLTRYQKGDLEKGIIPEGSPWFICEFRYNESSHVFNRIRTWRACLPDEIRDHPEPSIIPLKEPRRLIKYESPLKSLLPPNADVNMSIPPVTEGAMNTPPLVGSVYLREPDNADDLGQYYTSPNVTPSPENDDPVNNRKAFLFTPISQSKSAGGGGGGGYNMPSLPLGMPLATSLTSLAISNPASFAPAPPIASPLGGGLNQHVEYDLQYKFKQQIPTQRFKVEPRKQTPPVGIHATPSPYSNVLAGGTVSYTLDDDNNLGAISLSIKYGNKQIIWYRSPPLQVSNKIVTDSFELGHTAKYLTWKAAKRNSK